MMEVEGMSALAVIIMRLFYLVRLLASTLIHLLSLGLLVPEAFKFNTNTGK